MDLGTYQTSKQILIDLCTPPIVAGIFWLMAHGWVALIGPSSTTTLTRQRLNIEFRIVLVLLYLVVFVDTLYRSLT